MDGISYAGSPEIVTSPYGKAVWFDGVKDAIFLKENPIRDLKAFTIELLMKPDPDGPEEQRFLHIGEIDGDRLLLETRTTKEGKWYLDTFILSGDSKTALIDPALVHTADSWYHIAFILDEKGNMSNYVNGKFEMEGNVKFNLLNTGEMSAGARRNKVSWYKGAICKIKISPKVLTANEFMKF
jgi:hypothetical protein